VRQNAAGGITEYALRGIFCAVRHRKVLEKLKNRPGFLLHSHNSRTGWRNSVARASQITQN
jgi:hypothetical protein